MNWKIDKNKKIKDSSKKTLPGMGQCVQWTLSIGQLGDLDNPSMSLPSHFCADPRILTKLFQMFHNSRHKCHHTDHMRQTYLLCLLCFGGLYQTFLFFFLICVQDPALMINLYSCCIRPCPQYKVLPPLCSYSSPPLQSHQARRERTGEEVSMRKLQETFGRRPRWVHPGATSYTLATTKDLLFMQLEV